MIYKFVYTESIDRNVSRREVRAATFTFSGFEHRHKFIEFLESIGVQDYDIHDLPFTRISIESEESLNLIKLLCAKYSVGKTYDYESTIVTNISHHLIDE